MYNTDKISTSVNKQRLSLFGHILRKPEDIPANIMMEQYINSGDNKGKKKGRPAATLPTVLHDMVQYHDLSFQSRDDLVVMRVLRGRQ